MAEARDQGDKTEQPTQRRLDEARRKGQVASSREVHSLFVLAAVTLLFATAGGRGGLLVMGWIERTLETVDRPAFELAAGHTAVAGSLRMALLLLAPPLLAIATAAILASLVQNAVVFNREALLPKLERISPLKGAQRIFSMRGLAEFPKNMAKLILAGTAALFVLWPEIGRLPAVPAMAVGPAAAYIGWLALKLLSSVLAALALIALLDYAFQRHSHLRSLRMSRQELKDEHKETEGDPTVKQRLRNLRIQRGRMRMMAAVPESTVVVTNPTHFAVALRYEPSEMPAPRVVAKGTDLLALRIRDLARQHDVPVVENPPLARALYSGVEVGQLIPPAHYEAVAELIGLVMRLRHGASR